jgi:hypothetical protein
MNGKLILSPIVYVFHTRFGYLNGLAEQSSLAESALGVDFLTYVLFVFVIDQETQSP